MLDKSILTVLRKNKIRELDLSNKRLRSKDARTLADALKGNISLQQLDLSSNYLGSAGAQALAEVLKVNSNLQMLNLRWNTIGTTGAQVLAEELKVNSNLQMLNLGNNGIGEAGAQALAEALKVNSNLQQLSLADNTIGEAGAQALAGALKISTSLQQLNLCGSAIGEAGAQAIAGALKVNTSLQQLILSVNVIGEAATQALTEALKVNTSLQELILAGNQISTTSVQALAEALKVNSNLQVLNLSSNAINATGAQALAEALQVNTSLQQLILIGNRIGAIGAQALAEALKVNTSLKVLQLSCYRLDSFSKQVLIDVLKDNYTLTELSGIESSELRAYLERNRAYQKGYQQAVEGFGKLADMEIQDLHAAAQTIIEKLEGIEKYPKAGELKKKVSIFAIQRCFEFNEWESALTLNPELLNEPDVCSSFAEWLIRQEEIPAALALGNHDDELNRIRLAMLLLVEASQRNATGIPRREIETFKINIANRIIQNTKNPVVTDKVGLTTASLAEITGVERLLSRAEWQVAIEQAAKVTEDEENKTILNELAEQVANHSVEDVRTLLSYTVIKNSVKALYQTDNCLPVGVMLLSPESLPWKNQAKVSDTKALKPWFLRRQRIQKFASKQEEKQEAVDEVATWQTLGEIDSFKQQAIAALAAEAEKLVAAAEEERKQAEAETEQQRQAAEQQRQQEELARRQAEEAEKQRQELERKQAEAKAEQQRRVAEQQRQQEAAAQQLLQWQETKIQRWSVAKVILASSGGLLGLAAIGLGVSTAFISIALVTYLSIGAGSLSLLMLVGALSCWYQQEEIELSLTHDKISFSQEYIKDDKLIEPKAIANGEQYQPLFTPPASAPINQASKVGIKSSNYSK